MTEGRETQVAVEVLVIPPSNLRETQVAVEVLLIPPSQLRETQVTAEALRENREEWGGTDVGVGADDAYIDVFGTDSGVGTESTAIIQADTIVNQPFRIGVVATLLSQPFAIEIPPVATASRQPFSIDGPTGTRLSQPFGILGAVNTRLSQLFGIQSLQAQPTIGYWSGLTFTPGVGIFDKAGRPLGVVPAVHVNGQRERAIGETGSMQFYVPRDSTALALIQEDRLVLIGNQLGMEPWAGTIDAKRWDNGALQVSASDLTSTLADIEVEYIEEIAPGTPVWSIVQRLLALLNNARASRGLNELQWSLRVNGSTTMPATFREFRGDARLSGHVISLLKQIAERNQIEWHWQVRLVSGQLTVNIDLSEEFDAGEGAPIYDGPSGNVVRAPTVTFDPNGMVHGIRLVGQRTNIASYAVPWARWAVKEFQPEAFSAVDPGEYRYREDLDVKVDWSLSKAQQIQKARETEATIWLWYRSFLRAFHDQFGRPYHEGFKYQGPPSELEQYLHTGLGWRTWLKLVEVKGEAASAVMISRDQAQTLTVEYPVYAATPEQNVRRRWFSEAEGTLWLTSMSVHGYTYVYDVAGGVIIKRSTTPFDHSSATLSNYVATYAWPRDDSAGNPIVTYHTIRRVVSLTEDGAVTEGMYFEPTAGAWGKTSGVFRADGSPVFTRPTIGDAPFLRLWKKAAPDLVEEETEYLGKMYEFERRRVADWDPRRDGIGVWRSKPTIVSNQISTRTRWHIEPFGEGGSFTTDLQYGISSSETKIYVGNAMQVPSTVPFYVSLGREPGLEVVTVTEVLGDEFTVVRGQMGTTALAHEQGASVKYEAAEEWDGIDLPPYEWPEGEEYAQDLVASLSRPLAAVDLDIANEDGSWPTVRIGSWHDVDLDTEGPLPGGVHGRARVIGYAPSEQEGRMRLVLEFEVE